MFSLTSTRREFLRQSAILAGMGLLPDLYAAITPLARVIRATGADIWQASQKLDPEAIHRLLGGAIVRFTGESTLRDSWRSLVTPRDVVSIKVNVLAGRRLSSHVALVDAITQGLVEAGVKPENIIVWDRFDKELRIAGFTLNRRGNRVRCYGTENGYTSNLVMQGEVASRYSEILYDSTYLINVPVLKHHSLSGVSVSLKNWFGAIHNPNKYHGDGCNPFIADVNAAPPIRDKKQLIICDATLAQFDHGPGYKQAFCWTPSQILVSDDPVALDTVGWQMIEAQRKLKGLPDLQSADKFPEYLRTAADRDHRLGTHDLSAIQMEDV